MLIALLGGLDRRDHRGCGFDHMAGDLILGNLALIDPTALARQTVALASFKAYGLAVSRAATTTNDSAELCGRG